TGLPLLTYGLAEIGTTGGFTGVKVVVPGVAGLVLIGAFVVHALRTRYPLLDLRLYRRATFASASLTMFCLGAALFGSMILLPLYWQGIRHETVLDTGLLTAPQGLGMAIVLAVVLQRALVGVHSLAGAAGAYGTAFWWGAGLTGLSVVPCVVLARAERAARRRKGDDAGPSPETLAEAVAA